MPPTFRVLYVDDEPSLLDITRLYLEKDGFFSVDCVLSGSEALIRIATGHYDAIVADYQMPEMNGIALLQEVRKTDTTLPFILFTGRGREEVVIEAINSGADFYLQKGGDPRAQYAELAHKIRTAAGKRAAERAFKENENRYRSLVENMHDCVAVYRAVDGGRDFEILEFNEAAEKTEQVRRDAIIGHRVTEVFPGVQEFGILDVFRRVWDTGSPESFPVSLYRDNRISGWRDNFVYKLPSGEIVAIYRDETARKQVEMALQKSEEQYRLILDATNDGIWDWNIPTGTTFFSPRWYTMIGYEPGELPAAYATWRSLLHPDDIVQAERKIQDHIGQKNDFYSVEFRMRTKQGDWKWIHARGKIVERDTGGNPVRMVGTHTDITGQKEYEQKIAESSRFLATLIDTLPIPIFYKGSDGRYLGCNLPFEEYIGIPRTELLGKTVYDIAPVDLADAYRTADEKVFDNHGPQNYEAQVRYADGSRHDVIFYKAPFYNYDGSAGGLIGAFIDITERKRFESDLESKNQELMVSYEQLAASEEELRHTFDELSNSEQALRKSEERVRQKLESLLSPAGDTSTLELRDIIDAQELQSMMDDFYAITHMGIGIIDNQGNVLVGTGWQDICTKFHRVNPETCAGCIESDTHLTEGVEPGTFRKYKCKNNMWDIVTPIIIGGNHVGNIFLGQFLYDDESVDIGLFRAQAARYGFDEHAYLAALERVPRWSRETVDTLMAFYSKFARMISTLSFRNLTLARTVTERDNLLDTLQKSEERYRVVADFTYDWEYWISPEGKFIYVSPSCERITGYRPEEFLRDPDLMVSITYPDDRDAVTAHLSKIKERCPEYSAMQFRIITKNGGVRWIGHECQPVFNAAGECLGNRGSNRDITDNKLVELDLAKKREELLASYEQLAASEEELKNQFDALAESEQTLRLSEERVRTMIEQSPLSIQILSPDGRTVQVNRAFEELWGLTLENLKDYNILKDEQLTRLGIMSFIMRGFAGEACTIPAIEYDTTVAVGAGEKLWVLGHIYPVRDTAGTIRNVVIVHEDITERKRAIDALRESEERFRAIFNATFQFTGLMKPDGTLIEANQAAMDYAGETPDRTIDKPFWEAPWWRGNERRVNELKDAIRRAAGGEFVRYEVELQGAGDTRGIFDFSIKPVRDQDGTVVLLVPEGRDISDRKRAEETILRVNKKLNILNDITRRDLANQVFILKSYLELVKSSAAGHELILRNLQKIEPIVQSVSDITEFTRDYQDMGVSTPKWQNVKLALLFGISHVSLGMIQHSLETENLEIFADSLLEKAFQGLFENTLAHGGPATRVRVWYRRDTDVVVIIFEDDGAGIPQEIKEQIFLREGGSRASVRGLFFVREILDLTGITIRETGESGKGARFEISVPKGTFRFTDSG